MKKILSRNEFREFVFSRDNYKCVICGEPAKDVHHILNRNLWENGGYYLDNGASLCSQHHILAEETNLSCEFIRASAKINTILIPEHFFEGTQYDTWGNTILPNGQRLKGELFNQENVQKILKQGGVFERFSKYVKYPRTYHLPNSFVGNNDRQMKDDSFLKNKSVIVSLKKDGEATTMYNDYIHARSLDSNNHESRNWVKGLWGNIKYMLDDNMRVCGENLYAKHTIKYFDLPSYFMVYNIWIDDVCLSWQETIEYCQILGLETVPIIYKGIYDPNKIHSIYTQEHSHEEGYVIRISDEFKYHQFRYVVGKYVNPVFKQTLLENDEHWITKKIEINNLKK